MERELIFMSFAQRILALVLLAIVLTACGGSQDRPAATTVSSQGTGDPTAAATSTETTDVPQGAAATSEPIATETTTSAGDDAVTTTEPTQPAPTPTQAEANPTEAVVPTEEPTAEKAPSTGAAHSGTVVDASGKPVAHALVYAGTEYVRTDARGRFTAKTPNGVKDLTVMAPGFKKMSQPLRGPNVGTVKLEPFVAKGVYVSGIGDDSVRKRFYGLMDDTELNAIVINVKNDDGRVFTSKVPLAQESGASYEDFQLKDVVADMHKRGIYVIGRFTTFRDPALVDARPDLAVHTTSGNVWTDAKGHKWVDPYNRKVWEYFGDLGAEIAASGIDEIQFDYVRFPTEGDFDIIKFQKPSTRVNRPPTIDAFLGYMAARLRPHQIFISADTFGLTIVSDKEQGTGQNLELLAKHLDYYSPMIYPDHYGPGSFGYNEPSAYPYEVIYQSVERAQQRLKGTGVLVRPYLSAFKDTQYGQPFGLPQFIAQKKGAEEAGAHGWIYWNAGLIYPDALFEPE
ncbi:MAG: carboxypeptidase regulatory-like domain-containing protein [Chloroflexia bacterium]|nr:carboxypeptidase regulatory-like domain-containing protein [Chloroflexia bacterium]